MAERWRRLSERLWLWWHRRHGAIGSEPAASLKPGEFSHICMGCTSVLYLFHNDG
jgi:hypothetical protein